MKCEQDDVQTSCRDIPEVLLRLVQSGRFQFRKTLLIPAVTQRTPRKVMEKETVQAQIMMLLPPCINAGVVLVKSTLSLTPLVLSSLPEKP